jgi:outer membrane usher protein FimD/PapC
MTAVNAQQCYTTSRWLAAAERGLKRGRDDTRRSFTMSAMLAVPLDQGMIGSRGSVTRSFSTHSTTSRGASKLTVWVSRLAAIRRGWSYGRPGAGLGAQACLPRRP